MSVSYFTYALLLARVGDIGERRTSAQPVQPAYHLGHAVQLLLKNKVLLATTFMFMAFNIGRVSDSVWLPILSDQHRAADQSSTVTCWARWPVAKWPARCWPAGADSGTRSAC